MRRRLLRPLLLLAALAAPLAGCGGDEGPTSAPADCTPIEDGRFTLVAKNLAWNTECLRVPAGTDVTFTVDLQDTSVDHNLAISGPSGKADTPLERGPGRQTLRYPATTPGYHQFVCAIHPSMEGDLWVDPR
ncbi:MAG TPA: cupredoxin domain-containing protein [Acidimicrobiales bacterium]|nr:cupredoxin domain-containing protein [Acidimicrobiales bacterium]